jgi:ADP-ribose pyrophosphatase YjhB (NUDIX family)
LLLRDFIYLDTERVRSFSAQLLEGVPDTATREAAHEIGAEGTVEAGLLKVVRGEVGADYRYHRSASETRSLHHHVYTLMEEALEKAGFITTIDESFNFDEWAPDAFTDGQFVRVRGAVRLIDYKRVTAQMQAMPKMMKSLQTVELSNIKDKAQAGQIDAAEADRQRRQLNKTSAELRALPISDIIALSAQLYGGEEIRIKVRPSGAPDGHTLVGSAPYSGFAENPDSLSAKYGSEINADWVMLAQVIAPGRAAEAVLMPTGNQLEDAFEEIYLSLNELSQIASSAVFPAMAMTPISIYRQMGF